MTWGLVSNAVMAYGAAPFMRHTLSRSVPLSLILTALSASPALAFQKPPRGIETGGLEPAAGVQAVRTEVIANYTDVPASRRAAWQAFLADVGSDSWFALWDQSTGAPLRIFGSGIEAPGTVSSPAAAE